MTHAKRFAIVLCLLLLPATAIAEDEGSRQRDYAGWGVRLGLADSPDQAIIGVQYDVGEVLDRVHFEPNLELGFGDDHTVISATAAFHYLFDQTNKLVPYAGGGVAAGWVDRDRFPGDDSDFEIGLKVIGGVIIPLERQREFFVELDLGFGDLYDAEILIGWRF